MKVLFVLGCAIAGWFLGVQLAVGFVYGDSVELYMHLGGILGALIAAGLAAGSVRSGANR